MNLVTPSATSTAYCLNGIPGIDAAAIVSSVVDSGDVDSISIRIKDGPFAGGPLPTVDRLIVSPGYFSTLQIPLRERRLPTLNDDASHPLVVLVNRNLADRLFPGRTAIGEQIQIPTPDSLNGTEPYRTIVGVVGDVVQNGIASQRTSQVYIPYTQYRCPRPNLVFRTSGDPLRLAASLRAALRGLDSTLVVPEFVQRSQTWSRDRSSIGGFRRR